MTTGLILTPFDRGWSSGIKWAEMGRADAERARNSKVAAERRSKNDPTAFLAKTSDFQEPVIRATKTLRPQTQSKTSKLRALLREHGPLTTSEMSALSMVPTKHVPAYLKWDMDAGRVVADRSKVPCRYALVEAAE